MNWEQKLQALQALNGAHLEMNSHGDWYVALHSVSVKRGPFLETRARWGATPEAAGEAAGASDTELDPGEYVVVMRGGARSAVRWNGFMWAPVTEQEKP
jgi:hypothetical protein